MQRSMHQGARILVVDDNPAMLRLLHTLLQDEGMSVVCVESAPAARAALEASAQAPFDLVLSDISMPGEDGFELLQWIKREASPFNELPVLLMTAQLPEPEYRVRGLAMGAVDYVERPQDISELVLRAVNAVEHYRRLRSLETSLQDSEKLATVGRLLAASNHEIKNLVTLVRLMSEQLCKQFTNLNPLQAQTLAALEQASALLVQVTKGTSSLLAPEGPVNTPLNLSLIVHDVISLLAKRLSPSVLQTNVEQAPIWVWGHEVSIKQILINLLLNAADAIHELTPNIGGIIRIDITVQSNGFCQLSVIDNGIGLSEAGERDDFPPFVTTKRLRGGSGLGLWLSATLAKNMGGHLRLKSAGPGRGVTAELSLKNTQAPQLDPKLDLSEYLLEITDN